MTASFEDSMGPLGRRIARIGRTWRWRIKGLLGQPRTLLIEINWRLGDEVMALPVLDALHARFPQDRIAVLSNYPDLFLDNTAIARVNPDDPIDPDWYILLRGASRLEYRRKSYSERCGVPTPSSPPKLRYKNWDTDFLDAIPQGAAPLIALAPGASWPSKRWPMERWNELAKTLESAGARVVTLGTEGEGLDAGTDFTGRTGIRDAACLLHAAHLAVCCDSGLMHLALAADTPTIALFGPTDPTFLIDNEPMLIALRSTATCQGFWNHAKDVGEPGVCPEGHACCLEDITTTQVFDAVQLTLATGGA